MYFCSGFGEVEKAKAQLRQLFVSEKKGGCCALLQAEKAAKPSLLCTRGIDLLVGTRKSGILRAA